MIRILTLLILVAACTEFPQLDAAAPAEMPPRPKYLTPEELSAVNGGASGNQPRVDTAAKATALRNSADTLRAR